MKEDSKRLLRGMTEVSDQYILEAEAFYQKKDEQDLIRDNEEKERIERVSEEKENNKAERIGKEKKIIKMQEAKKGKFITIPRILGFTASIAAACVVLFVGVPTLMPKSSGSDSLELQGMQGENSDSEQAKGWNAEEVDSLQKATKLVGFDMSVPEGKEPFTKMTFTVIGGDMIEVKYSKEGIDTFGYYIRKGRGEEEISGDYTEYKEVKEVNLEGRKVTLKGGAGKYSLAIWEENGFSYAISALENPMTKDEMLEIVNKVD